MGEARDELFEGHAWIIPLGPGGGRETHGAEPNGSRQTQLRSIDPIPSPSYSSYDGAWPTTKLLNLGQMEPCGRVRGGCSLVKSL